MVSRDCCNQDREGRYSIIDRCHLNRHIVTGDVRLLPLPHHRSYPRYIGSCLLTFHMSHISLSCCWFILNRLIFVRGISRSVAFAVAVVVTVAVVAVAGMDVGGVEEDGHVAVAVLVVVFLDGRELVFLKEAGADNKEGHVGQTVDYLCVGNDLYGRAVKDYEVVTFTEPGDEPVKFFARQEFCRVGRHDSHPYGVECRSLVNPFDKQLIFMSLADKEVDYAVVRAADDF